MGLVGTEPVFDFKPELWMGEHLLSACSPTARAVWADVLCLMWKSVDRGRLVYPSGKPWSLEKIAQSVRGDTSESLAALRELLENEVASLDASGAVFNRKMVREEKARREARNRQARCRGSGKSVTGDVTPDVTLWGDYRGGNPPKNSFSNNQEKIPSKKKSKEPVFELPFDSERFRETWDEWLEYRREKRHGSYAASTLSKLSKRFREWGESATIESINRSITNGWKGLFEPRDGRGGTAANRVGPGQQYDPGSESGKL